MYLALRSSRMHNGRADLKGKMRNSANVFHEISVDEKLSGAIMRTQGMQSSSDPHTLKMDLASILAIEIAILQCLVRLNKVIIDTEIL